MLIIFITSKLLHEDFTTHGNNTFLGVLDQPLATQYTMSCAIEFLRWEIRCDSSFTFAWPWNRVFRNELSKGGIYFITFSAFNSSSVGGQVIYSGWDSIALWISNPAFRTVFSLSSFTVFNASKSKLKLWYTRTKLSTLKDSGYTNTQFCHLCTNFNSGKEDFNLRNKFLWI